MGGNKRKRENGSADDPEFVRSRINADKVKSVHAKLRKECAEGDIGDNMAAWVKHTRNAEGLAEYAQGSYIGVNSPLTQKYQL